MGQIYSFCSKYLIFPILTKESAYKHVFTISFIFPINTKPIFFNWFVCLIMLMIGAINYSHAYIKSFFVIKHVNFLSLDY